jgi:hypothetical protein
MTDDLIKRLRAIDVEETPFAAADAIREAADLIESQARRIGELERDARRYESELARMRSYFPVPAERASP